VIPEEVIFVSALANGVVQSKKISIREIEEGATVCLLSDVILDKLIDIASHS